jgi:mannose/fructose/N-acetylgalactosamine-specific phosphotransferase system component IIC
VTHVGPLLATVAVGGLAALDATPVAQTLLSQPLVTSAILGAIWGDWELALRVGVVLQILAASTLPIGARTPEDYATGGVIGVGLALALAAGQPFAMARDACALVGVLGGLLASMTGVGLIKWQRRRNEGLSRWVEAELRAGREAALGEAQRAAVVLAFGVGVGFSAAVLAVGLLGFQSAVELHSLRLAKAWSMAEPLWIGFGLAQLLNAFLQKRVARAALFGAALIGAWLVLMVERSQ